ncbi:hypothetical protein C8Q72DRAFT_869359 [Fomitopsis betulina]|nr:hypothetical protein C8Q72DRAFT_869359 [Fomitopsis betulina]
MWRHRFGVYGVYWVYGQSLRKYDGSMARLCGRPFPVLSMAHTSDPTNFFVADYILLSGAALYVYDRLLVFAQEIDLMWDHKNTGILIPFFYGVMHMSTALFLIVQICAPVTPSCENIIFEHYMVYISLCAAYLCWGVVSSIRVYAINGRRPMLPVLIFVISAAPIPTSICLASRLFNCAQDAATPPSTENILEIVTKSSSIISDAAVLYATWKTSGNIRALSRRVGGARVSLADVLITDGTLFFVLCLIANVAGAILYFYTAKRLDSDTLLDLVNLNTPLTTILVSRLLLNLRDAAHRKSRLGTSQMPTSSFARAIDILGNPDNDVPSFDNGHMDDLRTADPEPFALFISEDATSGGFHRLLSGSVAGTGRVEYHGSDPDVV